MPFFLSPEIKIEYQRKGSRVEVLITRMSLVSLIKLESITG